MKFLGKGLHSVVLDCGNEKICKYYNNKNEVTNEERSLIFLATLLKKGVKFNFKIPKYFQKVEDIKFEYENKKFFYRADMEKIDGECILDAMKYNYCDFNKLGTKLASIFHDMSVNFSAHTNSWKKIAGGSDSLFSHIVNEKGKNVLDNEKNQDAKNKVREVIDYLIAKEKSEEFRNKRHLSHLDISFGNIIVNSSFDIKGIVDWGSFGYTHPSLPFYQVVSFCDFWNSFEKEFIMLGGQIERDILYAAAVIHNTWKSRILKKAGIKYNFKKAEKESEMCYSSFKKYSI